ncbi:transglycosylase family protein [Streptomyces tailanensis]|uniref:LysM peptidoglycan-binding domain-containing protein n=1 Tax=Streptomyces tailanensis TaxID=2569858 RepID=UPI00122E859D|nr:transglycosylase family protein [Streptomyces tailanensis]
MLSGTGRHRRPRQAPALLVAAGVTGSAIAIPFLGATGASAASGTTWDQVADCESGGSWSADTGNGRYGGLQMTQESWESYGGLDYATSPDQASRSQQIAVAEKILADQGVGAWSTCGLLHNLGGDSGTADVDTGVADDSSNSGDSSSSADGSADRSTESTKSAESSETSDSSESSDSSKTSEYSADVTEGSINADVDSGDSKSSGDSDESGESGDSGGDVSQGSDSSPADDAEAGSGRHRGASADESDADDNSRTESSSSSSSMSSGRHASRDGEAARETVDAVHSSYTVREGDSLTSIADSLALQGGWRELYAENEVTVGTDPDLILPGQTLEVGVETGEE